ncbi:MAG: hypothetical protein OEW58_10565 [Gammaproteobacteria bacterium]|nr:hypothetical protein [Gammaproteobacteria bacterium]
MAKHETRSQYRQQDNVYLIEIFLKNPRQLFNSLDPSPFHEKDIDKDAEAYIVEAVEELHIKTPMRICIYLPSDEVDSAQARSIRDAVHHYFAYRALGSRRQLRSVLQQGRFSLLVGISFLTLCLALRTTLHHFGEGTLRDLIEEGLLIIGWVSMWRPIQIFLYDWWPVKYRQRIHQHLSSIDIQVLPHHPTMQN